MRHRKKGRKLSRTTSHRRALLKNLAISLIVNERVVTTEAKAKELGRVVEKLITKAKEGTLHMRRQVIAFMPHKEAVRKLFNEIAPRYKDRNGGYTRIVKIGERVGDAASMALIELVK
ncbi:MAG: 50S ribosomal protein L17 [Synergistetes bacterium]|nr:MAG: 50S ribosomal protein L17 [bacterium 42_11]MBC7331664.1 50S ribosomal protein L17 [Synergistota bacterium]MDK2872011.1 large subunit ribosomal protein [bacterium]